VPKPKKAKKKKKRKKKGRLKKSTIPPKSKKPLMTWVGVTMDRVKSIAGV